MKALSRIALLLLLALGLGGSAPASSGLEEAPAVSPVAEPQTGAAGEQDLDTFVPSERLPADSAVSFPVDI